MRVLDIVAHPSDLQPITITISQSEQFFAPEISHFKQLKEAINSIYVVISIESWWVCSHIKLSSIISHVLIQVISQFDMAANPL